MRVCAFSTAELGYRMLVGKCPPQNVSCPENKSIKDISGVLNKNTYCAGLAAIRKKEFLCVEKQIAKILENPKELDEFVDFYFTSLKAIGEEKQRMNTLLPAITVDERAKEDYFKSLARIKVLVAGLRYSDAPTMRLMIASIADQTSQSDYLTSKPLRDKLDKSFKETIRTAFKSAQKEIDQNEWVLENGVSTGGESLDRETRESLVQDTDLVEKYHQTVGSKMPGLEAMACQANAEYGTGAKIRDTSKLIVSILGARFIIKAVEGTQAVYAAIAGAAAAGNFTVRTAQMMRVLATVIPVGISGDLVYESIRKNCAIDTTLKSKSADQCDQNSSIESLGNDKCVANIALSALGGAAVFGKLIANSKKEVSAAQSVNNILKDDFAASGTPQQQALKMEKLAGEVSVERKNAEVVANYNANAPAQEVVNAPIDVTIKASNASLPDKMKERILTFKRDLDKKTFDRPILKRRNVLTSAKDDEDVATFLPGDEKVAKGLMQAHLDLYNKQKFADYVENLIAEVTRKMLGSGDKRIIALAERGGSTRQRSSMS